MKCRLIKPIGRQARVLFKDGVSVTLPEVYPMDTDMDDVRDKIDWDDLFEKYGDRVGWGLDVKYNTESGRPEPGDMYWHEFNPKYSSWANDDGKHLCVVLPNGIVWDIDSRARNCSMPYDKFHRCWVRKGTPPNVTVGKKGGPTCKAGGGSIKAADYHGFLRNGKFIKA